MEQQVLFWIFVTIFSATAIITLLGITNVIKIQSNFLTAMFSALILEVVAAIILMFNSFDFTGESGQTNYVEILQKANINTPLNTRDTAYYIAQLIKNSNNGEPVESELLALNNELDSLMEALLNCEGRSTQYETELNELEQTFYIKIKRLRDLISKYGGFINIAFQEKEKEDVYRMLIDIFKDLGMITNGTPIYIDNNPNNINFSTIKNMYRAFKKENGEKIKDANYVYLNEFDTILMIRQYLSIIDPVKR